MPEKNWHLPEEPGLRVSGNHEEDLSSARQSIFHHGTPTTAAGQSQVFCILSLTSLSSTADQTMTKEKKRNQNQISVPICRTNNHTMQDVYEI